jgi:hypothetical protein
MQQILHINPESELGKRLEEAAAEKKPLRVVSGDVVYDIQVQERDAAPPNEQSSDLLRVRRGLARSAGALRGIDLTALKQELRESREQDSHGRSA